MGLIGCALAAVLLALPRTAAAVPSFATQTGLPCSQCHVVAFGPQLTEYGRQFKLNGYTFKKSDGGINIPLSATVLSAYESIDTAKPAPSPFSDKANLLLQNASVYFAGGITDHLGAFVKATWDNVSQNASWDKMDVRYAHPLDLGGHSIVAGIDVNNYPGAQDLWNSLPPWGFPYVQSELAPFPNAAPVLRGLLGNVVLGASAYSMIDNKVYAELGFYKGLTNKWLGNLGDAGASANIVGAVPYGRVTYQQHNGLHYFEVGVVGLSVEQQPFTNTTATNRSTDFALDGSYQFNVGGVHAIDAHATWIHEWRNLDATFATGGSDATSNTLDTLEGDVAYIWNQTWVASAGLFATNGSSNTVMFTAAPIFGSAKSSPETNGYTAQLEWIPFGKSGSFLSPWLNLRLGLQYTGYWHYNGSSSNYDGYGRNASDNNNLFLFAWLAF